MSENFHNVSLLELASLFTYLANPEEIEAEQERLEALHQCSLRIFSVEYPTMSGAKMTRVTWARKD
jgi:hypothetical protein